MRKTLLHKTLRPQLLFAFIIFALSIPSYFLLVEWIWRKELDENNELIAERIENEFNKESIGDNKLLERIAFWNNIQPVSKIESIHKPLQKDSVYTVLRQNPYSEKKDIDRFRVLKTNIQINNQNFILTVETNVEETEETVAYIAVITLLFFLVLVVCFWLLNKRLSQKLWQPFRDTLQKLKVFQLNHQKNIQFQDTDTMEFHELNTALEKLLLHNISVYKTQKEFTENASHELQTPLAIIKNRLDILLQDKSLTNEQYNIIEEINLTLSRMSRINKNLLLLAKIENHQFEENETINMSQLMQQCLNQFEEYADNKNIVIHVKIKFDVIIEGNKTLVEMLINNLLINAIRHNIQRGTIKIFLDETKLAVFNSGSKPLNAESLYRRFAKTSNESVGSGLGLAIIQQICIRHNWNISYQFTDRLHDFSIRF